MAEFNIQNSKIEQVNDTGDNIKITGNSGHIAITEKGNVAQTEGSENKVNVDHKESFWTVLGEKIKSGWKWFLALVGLGGT